MSNIKLLKNFRKYLIKGHFQAPDPLELQLSLMLCSWIIIFLSSIQSEIMLNNDESEQPFLGFQSECKIGNN